MLRLRASAHNFLGSNRKILSIFSSRVAPESNGTYMKPSRAFDLICCVEQAAALLADRKPGHRNALTLRPDFP